jgi:hypothetical protein
MGFGDFLDRAIAPFAPRGARRMAARAGLKLLRQFDAAATSRRTRNWSRPLTDADAESWRARAGCAPAARPGQQQQIYRRRRSPPGRRHDRRRHRAALHHAEPAVAQKAQDEWKRWAEGKVDGHDDFYGFQKTAAWETSSAAKC